MSFTAEEVLEIRELIARTKNEDREAFEALYRILSKYIFAIAYGKTHNSDLAEETIQIVMLRIWKYASKCNTGRDVVGWIRKITVNSSITLWKKKRGEILVDFTDEKICGSDARFSVADFSDSAFERSVLERLTPEEAIVFRLRYQRYRYSEISKVLGVKESRAKYVYRCAIQRIRKFLDETE